MLDDVFSKIVIVILLHRGWQCLNCAQAHEDVDHTARQVQVIEKRVDQFKTAHWVHKVSQDNLRLLHQPVANHLINVATECLVKFNAFTALKRPRNIEEVDYFVENVHFFDILTIERC